MVEAIYSPLEELGLNLRQIKVYLALLKLGEGSAIHVARDTGLKHPTVYDVLEILKTRMLVSEKNQNGRRVFVAESPHNLHYAEDRRREALDRVLPSLLSLYSEGGRRPEVRCFVGQEATETVSNILLNCESREYFYFGQVSEMLKRHSYDYEREYLKKRLERGIRSNAIRVRESDVEPDFMQGSEQNLRRVRYITLLESVSIPELYLVDRRVLIHAQVNADFALVIDSPELFVLLKQLWDIAWLFAAPASTV